MKQKLLFIFLLIIALSGFTAFGQEEEPDQFNHDLMVGGYWDDNGLRHGQWYDRTTGKAETVDVPASQFPGAQNTRIRGVNKNKIFVGAYTLDTNPRSRGFLYSEKEKNNNPFLVYYFPDSNTKLWKINSNNLVIGSMYSFVDLPYRHQVFTIQYDSQTHTLDESTLTWIEPSHPDIERLFRLVDINDNGLIAGTYYSLSTGDTRGYIYDGTTFISVDYPDPNCTATTIQVIDNNGHYVGNCKINGISYGYIYNGTGYYRIDMLPEGLPNFQSFSGNTIVGRLKDAGGLYHGLIVTFSNGSFIYEIYDYSDATVTATQTVFSDLILQ
jgi:hypothetical protein